MSPSAWLNPSENSDPVGTVVDVGLLVLVVVDATVVDVVLAVDGLTVVVVRFGSRAADAPDAPDPMATAVADAQTPSAAIIRCTSFRALRDPTGRSRRSSAGAPGRAYPAPKTAGMTSADLHRT